MHTLREIANGKNSGSHEERVIRNTAGMARDPIRPCNFNSVFMPRGKDLNPDEAAGIP
jgi:hypothetical protein